MSSVESMIGAQLLPLKFLMTILTIWTDAYALLHLRFQMRSTSTIAGRQALQYKS